MSTLPTPQPSFRSLPPSFRAGDLLAWDTETGDDFGQGSAPFPPGTLVSYVLSAIVNNQPVRILIPPQPADAGGNASFAIPSATTAAWAPGYYTWVAFATDASGNRTEIAQGRISVQPDIQGSATPVDPRSYNEKLLANIRALLAGKALDDAAMYKIGTRELTRLPLADLHKWEALVEARVRRERRRRGENVPSPTIGIVFGGR